MSTLTLRVSGEKKRKPLKRCDEGVEELRGVVEKLKINEEEDYLDKLYEAAGVEQQIHIIRRLVEEHIIGTSLEQKHFTILENLVEIYLRIAIKHSLKSALVRLFSGFPDDLKNTVQSILVGLLTKRFESGTTDLLYIIEYVSSLNGCFENFSIGLSSVGVCKNKAVSFLEYSLHTLLLNLRKDGPPTNKLTIINGIHSCVRCTMTLIQKTSPSIPSSFIPLCKEILEEQQLPLDVRITCGILNVIISTELGTRLKLIEEILYFEDGISTLSLCAGFLSVHSQSELQQTITIKGKDMTLFDLIFNTIISIGSSNPADSNLMLGISRTVNLASKCLLNSPSLYKPEIVKEMLSFVWTHLEHYMDSVRHLTTSTLSNVVALGAKCPDANLFHVIIEALEILPGYRRCKQVALCTLIGHVPIGKILLKSPDLVETLLNLIEETSGATHAVSTLDSLMSQHFKEVGSDSEWLELWVNPLLMAMKRKPNPAYEQVLSKVVKLHPDVIHYILSLNKGENGRSMNIPLICLRVGRKAGFLNGSDGSKWKGYIEYQALKECLCHRSSEVSLACFALITDSQKTTEPFTKQELELLKEFFNYNLNNESPAMRQKSLAIFKKFITRLRDSTHALEKFIANKRKIDEDASMESECLNAYKNVITWLINFCMENLFPGANFSRRGSALKILTLCKEFGYWKNEFHTNKNGDILLNCLTDTYEENQTLASGLLVEMPAEILKFDKYEFVLAYINECFLLSSSIKPPDSIVAAYSLKILTEFKITGEILGEIARNTPEVEFLFRETEIKEIGIYSCLCITINQLKNELEVAQKSLLKAACSGPLYGQLFVIRHLLQKVDFSLVKNDKSWKYLIEFLIILAFDCNTTVACIVNSSSPEGLIPMDLDYDISRLENQCELSHVTSQMVLLCSWRSVKEVSLLLGELAERAPIAHFEGDPNGILSQDQILDIGDHLTTLLAETKHRGAFEQAYVGFCKLASTLWKFPSGDLHQLPIKWLKETLDEITTEGKLCATRRSAGIPFIIQGLVCTELEVGGGNSFQSSIKTLIELGNNAECSVETRTHAMNILRSLFRNSQLGEMVSPYVPEGIALAINGFATNTWSERNAATLLLSALMTRVFGVPRSRSHHLSWRNKMTGRIFFLRYPSLYSVLLKHLEAGSSHPSYHSSLYPVLLVLGRLYPSSLEGSDSNLQLYKYIRYVNECAGSKVLKTRSLAASAMVALITPNSFVQHISATFVTLLTTHDENLKHGLLLQVFNLFRSGIELPEEDTNKMKSYLSTWTPYVVSLLCSPNNSFMVKEIAIKVLHQLGLKFYEGINPQVWSEAENKINDYLFSDNAVDHKSMGIHEFHMTGAMLNLWLQCMKSSCENFIEILEKLLKHSSYDVYKICLDVAAYFFNDTKDEIEENVDVMFGSLDINFQKEVQAALQRSENVSQILITQLNMRNHHVDKKKLLTVIRNIPKVLQILSIQENSVIQYFNKISREEHELIGAIVVECINTYLTLKNTRDLSEDELNILCQICGEFSLPEKDYECRLAVSHLLINNFDLFVSHSSPINVLNFWTFKIRLLMDDRLEIRELASDENVNPIKSLETCLKRFTITGLHPGVKAVGALSWALGNLESESEPSVFEDDKVFDKGDMNVYSEEIVLNRLACDSLRTIVADDPTVVEAELPEPLIRWLTDQCCINLCGSSISNFLNYTDKLIRSNTHVAHSYPFLILSKKKHSLQEMKIRNIFSVLS